MFKLLDFISSSSKSSSKGSLKKQKKEEKSRAPNFTDQERAEIRRTVRTLNRETSMILTDKLNALHMTDLVEEADQGTETEEDDYSTGTFCVRKYNSDSQIPDDDDNYGTFCVRNTATGEQFGTFHAASTEGGPTLEDPKASSSTPDFSQMFREPEEWEKHILALERGEWTQDMNQNGAFKRWRRERPAVPSIYLRESGHKRP